MLSYKLADCAGLCAGVKRALRLAESLLNGPRKVCFWGPVIHNRRVMEDFTARGASVINSFNGVPAGGAVVFRAHGVPPELAGEAESLGLLVFDATCPHVRANQSLAEKKTAEGYQVVLIGDEGHPEAVGVKGWTRGSAIVAGGFEELCDKLREAESYNEGDKNYKRLCVMAQTTIGREFYGELSEKISERFPDCETFDTICNATSERQTAAGKLAGESDAVIVIGGKESSNARQLFAACSKSCNNVYQIEGAGDMPRADQLSVGRIGITASASTPDWIIEEVISKMEEMKRQDGDINFAEEMERPLITLQVGQTVKGRIIRFNGAEVYVDLGYKSDGVIPIEEFITDTEQVPENNIKIDDVIDVYVTRVNDSEGTVLLSKKRVDEKNNWARIEEAFENNTPIKAVVTDVTNGGLIVTSSGVRVFVPASLVSDRYVEDLRGYLRKPVELRIIDYNKQKRKFVGSMKALIVEDKRRAAESLWNEIEIGREYDGVVKSLTAFGAFVDIGGVDGLVHISELSWNRIKHPSDVVKAGEQISVRVISLDRDKKKISLGYRREEDNPWYKIEEKYPVGSVVTKRVVRIAPFGAFVELERGIDALVHVSQISDTRIAKPDDVLHVGMEVTAKITELNLETKKISMSIKEVEPIPYISPVSEDEPAIAADDELPTEHIEEMHTTLGDALGDMLKSSGGQDEAEAVNVAEEPAEEPVAEPAEEPVAEPAEEPAQETGAAEAEPAGEPAAAGPAEEPEPESGGAEAETAVAEAEANTAEPVASDTDTEPAEAVKQETGDDAAETAAE